MHKSLPFKRVPRCGNGDPINVKEMLRLHALWLVDRKKGLKVAHQKGHPASLQDANLIRAEWPDFNLSYANLCGACLVGCNLSGANLRGANLRGADLSYSDLRSVDLSEADLRGTDLSCADLRMANFANSHLGASLSPTARLGGTLLEGAVGIAKVLTTNPYDGPYYGYVVRHDSGAMYLRGYIDNIRWERAEETIKYLTQPGLVVGPEVAAIKAAVAKVMEGKSD